MAKSPKNWSPTEDRLPEAIQALHERLRDAGAAEARLVDTLLVDVLDNETDLEGYLSSLDELIGWAESARARLLKLQKTGK